MTSQLMPANENDGSPFSLKSFDLVQHSSRRSFIRRSIVTTAVAAPVVLLAACGGGDTNSSATNIDATPPTFVKIATGGSGSGYTKPHKDGRFMYSLQSSPREGEMGAAMCQVGQLVAIDASNDTVAARVPLLYKGPACTAPINGTDEDTTEPDHIRVSNDGKTLYISTAGGFNVTRARVRQEMIVDVTNPGAPVQKASVPVGTSTNHHGDALSGDGRWLFVTNNLDGTVTQIDTSTNQVTRTLTVRSTPLTVATFGTNEGPSEQTGPIR